MPQILDEQGRNVAADWILALEARVSRYRAGIEPCPACGFLISEPFLAAADCAWCARYTEKLGTPIDPEPYPL